ncbi:hypothetical protein ACJMK2_035700 [Sinanodonta woodiana]|uniref:Uncharacterized protein n=1 Tax=Sinanodonta woodiana TaxID=1069815 RepID=A0ABD3WWC0_SINWO
MHKTASTQLATASFTESEYQEVAKYVKKIRPQVKNEDSPTTVFLNRKGLKITNPSQYLLTPQIQLDLTRIGSTAARHSFETSSATLLKPKERSLLATYLAHSLSTAETNYVDIKTEQIQAMSYAISLLQEPDGAVQQSKRPATSPSTSSGNYPTIATSSSTTSPVPCMKHRSLRQPVEDPIQETRSSSSSPFASQEHNANKNYYQPLFKHFKINVDKELPTKYDIKAFAEKKIGM